MFEAFGNDFELGLPRNFGHDICHPFWHDGTKLSDVPWRYPDGQRVSPTQADQIAFLNIRQGWDSNYLKEYSECKHQLVLRIKRPVHVEGSSLNDIEFYSTYFNVFVEGVFPMTFNIRGYEEPITAIYMTWAFDNDGLRGGNVPWFLPAGAISRSLKNALPNSFNPGYGLREMIIDAKYIGRGFQSIEY